MKKYFFIISIIFISSCGVYYNTFYNAEKYYQEALSAKATNNYKVNSNIEKKLDKVISRCAYVLKEYPDNKYADDALLLMGQSYFEYEKYLKALKKFQEFEKFYPESSQFPIAKLYLMKTYLKLMKFDEANSNFLEIKNSSNFLSVRVLATLEFSDYYLQKNNFQKAKELLKSITKMNISEEAQQNIFYQIAQIEFQNDEYENALNSFKSALAFKSTKRMKLDITFLVGKTYIKLSQYENGLKLFEKLKKDESNSEKIAEIDLQIGICNAHLGKIDNAFSQFETLIEDNLGKHIVSEINYQWAEIYFSILKDYQKAIEKFQKVTKQNEDIFEKASEKEKIANLFFQQQNQTKSNEILELAKTKFKIAEYYNLDLSQPDSAIVYYDKILDNISLFPFELISLNQKLDTLKVEKSKSEEIIIDSLASILDSISIKIEIDSAKIFPLKNFTVMKDSIKNRIEKLKIDSLNYQENIYPKALLLKVWTLTSPQKDTISATKIAKKLEQEFPDSKFNFAAQRMIDSKNFSQMNFSDSLITKEEFDAKNYLRKASNYFDESINFEKCISYLDTIITQYPNSGILPKVLYSKAKLLLEEKSDTLSAKLPLQKLFQNYPQHELTKSLTFFDGKNFIIEPFATDSIPKDTLQKEIFDSLKIEDEIVFEDSLKIEKTSADTAQISMQKITHTVKKGECLWVIAGYSEVYGNPFDWPKIFQANADQIQNPDLIYPNQIFHIPND